MKYQLRYLINCLKHFVSSFHTFRIIFQKFGYLIQIIIQSFLLQKKLSIRISIKLLFLINKHSFYRK